MRRTAHKPKNWRIQQVPQQRDLYARVQQQFYHNTLVAGGNRAIVYNYLLGGVRCTCSGMHHAPLLDEDGDLLPHSLERVAQHIYGDTRRVTLVSNDLDFDEDFISEHVHEDDTTIDTDGELVEDLLSTQGFDQNHCGVCYGVGIVGGYDIDNGSRIVLDSQTIIDTDHTRVTSQSPHFHREGTYATWQVILPAHPYAKLVVSRLWNNRDLIPQDQYELELPTSGVVGNCVIHTEQQFTHLELQYRWGNCWVDLPYIQNVLANLRGDQVQTTLLVSPEVTVRPLSIIRESKYGRAWHVTSVLPQYDLNGVITQWECEARMVQNNEHFNLLSLG